jgi:uncharacterized protein YndB with AHSA1/START domain
MKRTQFSTNIDAPREKVWNVLWNDATYRQWTSVFCEGSYADTDWKEGSKALFLGPGGDGMFSTIAKSIPNEFMSIRHLGEIKNGIEQPIDEKTSQWSGAMENYTLSGDDGSTTLTVDIDVVDEHFPFINDVFPKALDKVKAIAEN